jgi:hypothetical protein
MTCAHRRGLPRLQTAFVRQNGDAVSEGAAFRRRAAALPSRLRSLKPDP